MIEVYPKLWVGSDADVPEARAQNYAILHCAKDPWHREAVGYARNLNPEDPEYLWADRGDEVYLNLVDGPWVPAPPIVGHACEFMARNLAESRNVLVHCNKGQSRAPTLAAVYLHLVGKMSLEEFARAYLPFCPGKGMKVLLTMIKKLFI